MYTVTIHLLLTQKGDLLETKLVEKKPRKVISVLRSQQATYVFRICGELPHL
jgi:hypothetical protein